MKTKIFSVVVMALLIMASCSKEKTEQVVSLKSEKPTSADVELALKKLPEAGIDVSKQLKSNLKSTQADFFVAWQGWSNYPNGDIFPSATLAFNSSDCAPSGSEYYLHFWRYTTNYPQWESVYEGYVTSCLNTVRYEDLFFFQPELDAIYVVEGYYRTISSNPQYTYLGYAYSNWVHIPLNQY